MSDDTAKPAEPVTDATDGLVIKLRKKITAHDQELSEIRFREPTGGDIEACGNPVIMDMGALIETGRPGISFDEKKMSAMIARLAVIPPSSVRQMDPRDWTNACWTLMRFFVPDLGTPTE